MILTKSLGNLRGMIVLHKVEEVVIQIIIVLRDLRIKTTLIKSIQVEDTILGREDIGLEVDNLTGTDHTDETMYVIFYLFKV